MHRSRARGATAAEAVTAVPQKLDRMLHNARLASEFLKALSHETRLLLSGFCRERALVTDLENPFTTEDKRRNCLRSGSTGCENGERGENRYSGIAMTASRVIALLYEKFLQWGRAGVEEPAVLALSKETRLPRNLASLGSRTANASAIRALGQLVSVKSTALDAARAQQSRSKGG